MLASKLCTISRRVSRRLVTGVVLIVGSSLGTENSDRTSETENYNNGPAHTDFRLADANNHRRHGRSRQWLFPGRSGLDARPFPIRSNRSPDSQTNAKH